MSFNNLPIAKKKSTKQKLQGAIHVIYYFLMFPFLFVLLVVVCSALGSIITFEKKKQQIKALVLLTGLIVCFVIWADFSDCHKQPHSSRHNRYLFRFFFVLHQINVLLFPVAGAKVEEDKVGIRRSLTTQ